MGRFSDNGSPAISSVVVSNAQGGSTTTLFGDNTTVAVTATDLFGVQGYFVTDNASYTPSLNEYDNFTTQGRSVTQSINFVLDNVSSLQTNDEVQVYIWVRDAAGNVDSSSDSINYLKL